MDKSHILSPVLVLLLPIALAMACGSGSDVPPRPTKTVALVRSPEPTDTPVPTEPTDTPTPVQTPQADIPIDELSFELFEEAYFMPGAGPGTVYGTGPSCRIEEPAELPAVRFVRAFWAFEPDGRVICLYDFPLDEQITVSFHAPNGDPLVSGDFIADEHTVFQIHPGNVREEVGWVDVYGHDYRVVGIDTAWPATLPNEGYMGAVSASAHAESPFDLGLPGDEARVSVLPTTWANGGDPFVVNACFVFSAGDKGEILGTGFEPNSRVPLGVYLGGRTPGERGKLILSEIMSTNDQGNFHMRIQIEPSDPAEYYHVLAVTKALDKRCLVWLEEHDDCYTPWGCNVGPIGCFQVR